MLAAICVLQIYYFFHLLVGKLQVVVDWLHCCLALPWPHPHTLPHFQLSFVEILRNVYPAQRHYLMFTDDRCPPAAQPPRKTLAPQYPDEQKDPSATTPLHASLCFVHANFLVWLRQNCLSLVSTHKYRRWKEVSNCQLNLKSEFLHE